MHKIVNVRFVFTHPPDLDQALSNDLAFQQCVPTGVVCVMFYAQLGTLFGEAPS